MVLKGVPCEVEVSKSISEGPTKARPKRIRFWPVLQRPESQTELFHRGFGLKSVCRLPALATSSCREKLGQEDPLLTLCKTAAALKDALPFLWFSRDAHPNQIEHTIHQSSTRLMTIKSPTLAIIYGTNSRLRCFRKKRREI